jgi:hypothetical protein
MFKLRPLSKDAIPGALAKAERYRLLNESSQAESICRDILAVDPGNQDALVALLLALTDQFDHGSSGLGEARKLGGLLRHDYERAYYTGIVCERQGIALFRTNRPGTGSAAYEWIREAMDWYEKAEPIRPSGNDDAILRWNTCARFLMRHPELAPREEEAAEPLLLE